MVVGGLTGVVVAGVVAVGLRLAERLPELVERTAGANLSPAVIDSEARPICWLVRWLAAIATAAAIARPSRASPIHLKVAGKLIREPQ